MLITGCGDVGLRLLRQLVALPAGVRVIASARRTEQLDEIRALGGLPIRVDLDNGRSLGRLASFATRVVHLAPPPGNGTGDPRTRRLIAALSMGSQRQSPRRWAYVSTTGVYGNCDGAIINENRPCHPDSERARRRVAAETLLRAASRRATARTSLLRAPGIYAAERLPLDRLRGGLPALRPDEDVWTNHIHADDLAHACWLALVRGLPGRAINVVDDSSLRMGEYFDQVADALGFPRPPRLARSELARQVSPMMLSFMSESRRIENVRMRKELRLRLRFPTVSHQLALLK